MNLEQEILKEHSKRKTQKIACWIGADPERFSLLMKLFLHGEPVVVQRSAWIVSQCAEQHPSLILPWLKKLIARIEEKNLHNAVQRNGFRALQFVDIPRSLQGKVFDLCLNTLRAVENPVAVKVYAMYILKEFVRQEPDLKQEVLLTVQEMLPYSTGGILSAAKKMIVALSEKPKAVGKKRHNNCLT